MSSMLSSLSISTSPGLIFICLKKKGVRQAQVTVSTYDRRMSNLTSLCSQIESTAAPVVAAMVLGGVGSTNRVLV